MDIKTLIKERRSVRKFKPELVPLEEIKEMLDVARHAPSACNYQCWRFIIITDQKIKDEIFDNGGSIVVKNSPQSILFIYDNRTDNDEYKDYVQSTCAAIENFMLYAKSKGIGTCWINHLPKKKILQKIFKLEDHYDPIAMVAFGYPEKEPAEVPRKEIIDEMVGINAGNFKPIERNVKSIMVRKVLRKFYYKLPKFIKKPLNNFIDKKLVKKFDN